MMIFHRSGFRFDDFLDVKKKFESLDHADKEALFRRFNRDGSVINDRAVAKVYFSDNQSEFSVLVDQYFRKKRTQ